MIQNYHLKFLLYCHIGDFSIDLDKQYTHQKENFKREWQNCHSVVRMKMYYKRMKTLKHVKHFSWLNKYDGLKLLWSCKRLVACQCLPEVNRMYPENWKRRKRLYKMSDMYIIIIRLRNRVCRTHVYISGVRLFSYESYHILLLIKYNLLDRPYPACFIFTLYVQFLLDYICSRFILIEIAYIVYAFVTL